MIRYCHGVVRKLPCQVDHSKVENLALVASMLPVWVLLQPRNFINGMQLFVGLVLLYGAVLLALPDISALA